MATRGSELAALLREANLSREQMAERLGVSVQAVHNWCRGRTPISIERLREVADVLLRGGTARERIARFVQGELMAQGIDDWMLHDSALGHAGDAGSGRPVVIPVWTLAGSPVLAAMALACRNHLEHLGHRCIVADCGGSHSFLRGALNQALRLNAAGVFLLAPGSLPDPPEDLAQIAALFRRYGVAVVFGRFWRDPLRLPPGAGAVCWDVGVVAAMAAEALAKAGHRRVSGLFGGSESVQNRTAQQFQAELRARNMDLTGTAWRTGLRTDPEDILIALRKSTAIFADSPSGVMEIAHTLNRAEVEWPSEVSIVGVGSRDLVPQMGKRPFTMIDVPLERMGKDAAELLARLINEPDLPLSDRFIIYGEGHISITHELDGSLGAPASHLLSRV